jgi:hypothetical protein
MIKGDPDQGSPPRAEPPFNFAVTKEAHDWSWGKKGVCLYCVHCCQLQERVPIQKLGYPVRVVDPPTWPADRETGLCTWYVYKDPSLVPDEAFRRVGFDPVEHRPRTRGTSYDANRSPSATNERSHSGRPSPSAPAPARPPADQPPT